MKKSAKLVLAALAVASCAAGAQTVYSGQSDQERRDRNREEALSNYRAHSSTSTSTASSQNRHHTASKSKAKAHHAESSTKHATHEVAESTREATHKSANAVRHAGHKTAQEARDITAKTDAKLGAVPHGKANPEGINPLGVSSASPTAPSNGVTK
jgi:cytoskeletal protein RodZ